MTFEKYLTDNCGLRILEGLTNLGMHAAKENMILTEAEVIKNA